MSLSLRFAVSYIVIPAFLGAPLRAETAPPEANPWDNAATFQSNDAYTEFSQNLAKKKGDPRELNLGIATSLIGVQPKTASNINRAAEVCEQLIRENPNDQVGILATYLLARIEQFHRQPPNLQKAEEIYRRLFKEHPDNLIAQLGVSKLATLLLFPPGKTKEDQLKALAELDSILPALTFEQARRDTLFLMGNACIMFKLNDEKALKYLIDADAAKITNSKLQGDTYIRIATTAQRLNKKDIALKYYGLFVDKYKRDTRNYLVRQKMAELTKSGS